MSARGNGGAACFGLVLYDTNRGDEMLVLIGFLYLALPFLSSGATGVPAGIRMTHVDRSSPLLIGLDMGLIAIAANIGYGFLWGAFYEWRYASVAQLSETRVVFIHYVNQQEREIAFLVGPVIIAGIGATGSWLACLWWNKRQVIRPRK